jgi:hypothetical protein
MPSLVRMCPPLRLGAALAMAVFLTSLVTPSEADAQYFGRNKVQYENFDFRILKTPQFDVYFYPEEEPAVRDAARMMERWNTRFQSVLEYKLTERKPIIYYANHPDFQQTNVISGLLQEGTGGVTESLRNRVIMPLTGDYAQNDHVSGHELVHVYQYDMVLNDPRLMQGFATLPLWITEGMAEYLSVGRFDPLSAMWMRDATFRKAVPTLKQLTRDPRYFPYRYGQAFWAYVGGKWGDDMVGRLFRTAVQTGWEEAMPRALGMSPDSLGKEWQAQIRATYEPLLEGRTSPREAGDAILLSEEPGEMNVSPVVSPDGRHVAFFSSRGLFGIELYLADAETGEIVRKLVTATRDAHYDAVSFINSAGAWSPDGRQLAILVYSDGDNQIHVLDARNGRVVRRIEPKVGAVSGVSWSPDGRTIAYSGIHGGISDLYLYDLESKTERQITDDKYADLHPSWSPDGRSIAFSTDRGPGTNFQTLAYEEPRIAIIDVATGQVRALELFAGASHINPVYSPDGSSIYFVSTQDGFPDLYRVELASNQIYRLTKTATGVSGITLSSPAVSVARETGRVVFSVFYNAGFDLMRLEPDRAVGTPIERPVAEGYPPAGLLPPVQSFVESSVARYLQDPLGGLPTGTDFTVAPYRPTLGLLAVGQPSFGVGVSAYGTSVGGGASVFFGDMLQNRILGVAIGGGGSSFKDIGGQVFFQNVRRRWGWVVGASHLPYLTGQVFVRPVDVDLGDGNVVQGTEYGQVLQRVYLDEVSLGTQYPFSLTRRFEFSTAFRRQSYDMELQSIITVGNTVIDETRENIEAPPAINMALASAAYVGDYSYFGFTSPVAGGRYRLEVGTMLGDLKFQTLLADYRRYFLMRPFTLAFRGLHYGRYGKGAEDERLSQLYLGSEQLIRGYSASSFDALECARGATSPADCPVFDRLLGSRVGVFNAEFRIPLIGTEQFGLLNFPFLPTEISPFFDAGVAWTKDENPVWEFDRQSPERIPIMSWGIAARFNLFGYLIGELYYANPLQRPEKSGVWGFQIAPGW